MHAQCCATMWTWGGEPLPQSNGHQGLGAGEAHTGEGYGEQSSAFFFFFFLSSRPGIEPAPTALVVQSLNNWTTKEVPKWLFKIRAKITWSLVQDILTTLYCPSHRKFLFAKIVKHLLLKERSACRPSATPGGWLYSRACGSNPRLDLVSQTLHFNKIHYWLRVWEAPCINTLCCSVDHKHSNYINIIRICMWFIFIYL